MQVLHGMHTDDPSYVLRIDKASGKTRWRVERPTRARFESPGRLHHADAAAALAAAPRLVITGGDVVTGHDLAIGP